MNERIEHLLALLEDKAALAPDAVRGVLEELVHLLRPRTAVMTRREGDPCDPEDVLQQICSLLLADPAVLEPGSGSFNVLLRSLVQDTILQLREPSPSKQP